MHYIDYHIHSLHSFDSKTPLEDMCASAINKSLKEICFAEHFSVGPETPTYGYMNFDKYFKDIEECKNKYSNSLKIRTGLEICEPHLNIDELKSTLENLPLDFIIGSVHNVDKLKLRNFIKDKSNYEAYKKYFEEAYNAICFGDMDIFGHLDLLKRYAFDDLGNYKFIEFKDLLANILRKAVERNIGIEINTSGMKANVKETFPSMDVLKLYKDLGGEIITIGSDAHDALRIGDNFYLAIEMLKQCGFNYIFTFENREPTAINI